MLLRDLHLDGEGPTYEQIYRSIRGAILAGRAESGMRLPSSRWLASDLAVSRNTVTAAYDQLLAEGYAVSRVGSGTYVAPQLRDEPARATCARERSRSARSGAIPRLSQFGARLAAAAPRRMYDGLDARGSVRIDFMPCVPGVRARSSEAWRRCVSRVLARSDAGALHYGDPSGVAELRRELAGYLARSRGVVCAPEEVAIVSGASQAVDLCTRLLLDAGDAVLVEDPLYIGARRAFELAGAELVPAAVDRDGLRLDAADPAALARCKLGYLTPSHQFPTGAVLSLSRRMALLDWAQSSDAYLIEDDYDSEFRYAGRSIEPLKSLDAAERVIYMGTLSKVFDPGLRLAYLVLPPALRSVFREAKWLTDWASPSFEQEALALFIGQGEFERHLRRMRTLYGRKRETLLSALEAELRDTISVHDGHAGLHVMVEIPQLPHHRAAELYARALDRGVALYSATPYYAEPPRSCRMILGFTLPDEAAIREGVAILAELVRAL